MNTQTARQTLRRRQLVFLARAQGRVEVTIKAVHAMFPAAGVHIGTFCAENGLRYRILSKSVVFTSARRAPSPASLLGRTEEEQASVERVKGLVLKDG
jgi:hypothetical protein